MKYDTPSPVPTPNNQPPAMLPPSPEPTGSPHDAQEKKLSKPLIITATVIILAVLGMGAWYLLQAKDSSTAKNDATGTSAAAEEKSESTKPTFAVTVLEKGKKVLPDGRADPTIIKTDFGYRMYVNRQSGGPNGVLIYRSDDGVNWKQEKDIILPGTSTSRAVAWPGGGVRLYYPGAMPIRASDPPASLFSSFSSDGLNFTKDAGALVDPKSSGHYLEGPTVLQLIDKTWRMYFNENTTAAGNQRDGIIWGATSTDGTTWKRDTEPTLQADETELGQVNNPGAWPQVLHPFVAQHPDGGYIMLYNTHSEIFAATSDDGKNWKKQGKVGIHGADADGYFQSDGTFRIFYGDFSEATGGLVYTGVLKFTK